MISSLTAKISYAETSNTFKVTLLGTGTPVPQTERSSISTLVEVGDQKLIFDFGRKVAVNLWQLKVPLGSIDAHFLTHFHSDHLVGFTDLWLTGWLRPPYGQRNTPMVVYGPPGIKHLFNHLQEAFSKDIRTRHADEGSPLAGISIESHEVNPGLVYEHKGVKVYAFENDHGELVKPSYGYKIEFKGKSVVVSGDTRYSESVIQQATDTDLLIYPVTVIPDALLKQKPEVYQAILNHLSSPEDAARVFIKASPKFIVFSHIGLNGGATIQDLVYRVSAIYKGSFVVGEDLMQITIDSKGETQIIRNEQSIMNNP